MEMMMKEENERRKLISMADDDFQVISKRRRREPPSAALTLEDKQSQKQQICQNSTTSTTKRSSRFRGVSRHRWTGRYEAHLWDKLSWNMTQKKKGKQGAYDDEESAARAYDLAALKYWGTMTVTNFPVSDYEEQVEIMQTMTKEEYLATLRRKSSGFSRGASKYRGVARHHHNGRWEARIGRVFGNKYLYLGTYSTQEEAARAYDIAAIEYRGSHAITNFDLSTYMRWLKSSTENISETKVEKLEVPESQAAAFKSNYSPIEGSKTLALHNATYNSDYLNSAQKYEVFDNKTYQMSNTKSSSSPTALGLLFRSTIFRELVQKNSDMSGDETDWEDTKDKQPLTAAASDDELDGIFCDGIGDTSFLKPQWTP
ncbi:AP2 domain transcription factor [Medicago truncatula]|uniref:AP2 domain transcription factor n=1 Tax=Medicago truncatula TaxID=3880 RepID=A0A072U7A0_MEDTR|nr:AP2 domain transcription factor [Medicago truncatula]